MIDPSLKGPALAAALAEALVAGPMPKADLEAVLPGVAGLGAVDIVEAVDALVAGTGGDLEALKPGVSRLLRLCREALEAGTVAPATPLFAFLAEENRRGLEALEALRAPVAALTTAAPAAAEGGPDGGLHDAAVARSLDELTASLEALAPFLLHYERLENVVFPWFETHFPRYRCLTLMWSIHDDVRRSFKALRSLAGRVDVDPAELGRASGRIFFDLHSLAFREERALFPVLAGLLGPEEDLGLYRECRDLGPGLLDPAALDLLEARASGWAGALEGAGRRAGRQEVAGALRVGDGLPSAPSTSGQGPAPTVRLDAGALEARAIDAILKSLRADLTFIGPDDRVAYFSNGPHRVFPRSPAIIGRDVRNCHPHESLGRVLGLIEDLRSGRRDREEFWISRGGRFVHIEYAAVRDPKGEFLGVLEASEDLTEKRGLSGEKRIAAEG